MNKNSDRSGNDLNSKFRRGFLGGPIFLLPHGMCKPGNQDFSPPAKNVYLIVIINKTPFRNGAAHTLDLQLVTLKN